MRILSSLVAVLLCVVCGSVSAAGPFDGIYQTGPKSYFSIHQLGDEMIIGEFSTVPAFGIVFTTGDRQAFVPERADVWDLFKGRLIGTSATLFGETIYGACNLSMTITFGQGVAFVTRNFLANTTAGTRQGVSCPALFQHIASQPGGRSFTVQRVF